jgi:hypothetical protein
MENFDTVDILRRALGPGCLEDVFPISTRERLESQPVVDLGVEPLPLALDVNLIALTLENLRGHPIARLMLR